MNGIKSNVSILTDSEIESIVSAAVSVVSTSGVRIDHSDVVDILWHSGAQVDKDSGIVRFPAAMVFDHIDNWRSEPKRESDGIIKPVFGNVSTQIYVFDPILRKRRSGTKDDLLKGICLVDKLDAFITNNAVVYPADVPTELQDVYALHKVLTYAKKPGKTYYLSSSSAYYIFKMLSAAGKPVSAYLTPVSPLQYTHENLEICLLASKNGGTITTGSMITAGLTGPVTIAGTLSLATAELISSQIIIEALTGKHAEFGCISHTMEPSNLLCSFGSPNQGLIAIAASQLAKYLNLSPRVNSGLSDALLPDFQSAAEKSLSGIMSILSGCSSLGAMGIAGADQGICFEQLYLDNEWLKTINYVLQGFEVSDETIALDEILKTGQSAKYLDTDFTAEHFRDNFLSSSCFSRQTYDQWLSVGSTSALQRASAAVEHLTLNYMNMEPVIESETQYVIDGILEEASANMI